jgi:hypothetical protein
MFLKTSTVSCSSHRLFLFCVMCVIRIVRTMVYQKYIVVQKKNCCVYLTDQEYVGHYEPQRDTIIPISIF